MSRTTSHSCDTPFLSKIEATRFLQEKRACPQNVVLCEARKNKSIKNMKCFFEALALFLILVKLINQVIKSPNSFFSFSIPSMARHLFSITL